MKQKKTLSDTFSPGTQAKIDLLKDINDILIVCTQKGQILLSHSSVVYDNYSEKLTEFLRDSDILSLIKKGGYNGQIEVGQGRIRLRGSLLEKKKNGLIVFAGNFYPEVKKGSLLWDSFFSKNACHFSPLIELLTGYNSEELNNLPGKGFNLLSAEDSEETKKTISSFLIDKNRTKLELIYRINDKDGNFLWIKEIIVVERDSPGTVNNYFSSISELTNFIEEKISVEAALNQLQQMNRDKDHFISVLSHDLKSPYTSILGFSEILLNESSLSADERTEYLSYINLSSQNQLKLINNLLEWSRLVTGRKQLDPVKLNLKNIINNIISNNTRSIHKKNLDIKISGDGYFYVVADERLLTEALSIIITNAVKYSLPGRTIEIYLNRFRESQVEVIIKDEGVGISEKNKSKIMKMDQIFSTTGTSGERGTGISLLLAQEIIKSHKGEMWFYSDEGVGSEFHLTIPSAGNMMLLVDKDELEKQKIINMLNSGFPGFRLSVEKNFYDAFERINRENPVIIILSHNLPFMNGLEFVKNLKKEEKFAFTPVIVYSGELNEKVVEGYKEAGVTEVLSAPVNLKILKDKVEELLK